MKKIIPLIFILLMIVGCAPKIYVNGAPANSNFLMVRGSELDIFAHAHRHYIKHEGAELMMVSESIVFEDVVSLPANTIAVSVVLRIANESNEHYQLWETYVLTDDWGEKTYSIDRLYDGQLSMKEFNLQAPIRNMSEGIYSLRIADGNGEPLFVVGTVRYQWKEVIEAE